VLIIWEWSSKCIFAYNLILYLPCYYLFITFISCTCWVPTISVLNLAIFPLLLKLAAQKEKMDWNSSMRVLGYVLPRLPFLWSCEAFRYSVSLRDVVVFRDNIYVIIILYSRHLAICKHFWPYVWNNRSILGHTYDEYLVLLIKSGMTEVVLEPCQPLA
jgi:hypothetical protein